MTEKTPAPAAAAEDAIRRRMDRIGAPAPSIESFLRQYRRLREGHTGLLDRTVIEPLNDVPDADALAVHRDAGAAALPRTVLIKLNGGLGTSMGLRGTKSLLPVKDGRNFLDLLAAQVAHVRRTTGHALPLVLMNSFNTHEETLRELARYPDVEAGQKGVPLTFIQNQVPKIRQDDLMPLEWPADPSREWSPPGHGDLYLALSTSGTLQRLLDKGFEYAFVSNADNLGATLSLPILGYLAAGKLPFIMEVTARTDADRKGGHIARMRGGALVLRERAQCPDAEQEDFQDILKYRHFNTNNLWVNLRTLKEVVARGPALDLPLIVNRKAVDGTPVFQLETAMGSAISVVPGAQAVSVPRSRFAPVKTTDDLLALWSDACVLTEDSCIRLHPARKGKPVFVRLDPAFYQTYDNLKARFPHGAPSLLECTSLVIEGDYRFGRGVTVRGDVRLSHPGAKQRLIPDGAEVFGNR
jgi:UTP--glucose-1-phosphate uridylyltransferase